MNKIDEIRNRINKKNPNKKNLFLTGANVFLSLSLICLISLIYIKVDENARVINSIFKTNYSFIEFNDKVESFLNNIFSFNKQSEVVSLENEYISLGNNNYQTDDKVINMLQDGKISAINYSKERKYFVVVSYINNVVGLYTLIDNINLKVDDVLKKNDIIGSYESNYFNCIFKSGEEIISYNNVI